MTVIVQGGRVVRAAASPLAQLRETVADITRQIEDRSWTNLSSELMSTSLDDDYTQRQEMIRVLRLYRRRSPLAKQAAKLLQHYTIGRGVNLRPNNKTQVARIVDEFWDDPTNRSTFTSHSAMQEFIDTVHTDGAAILLLQPDIELGTVKLGTIDVWNLEDIICDPENWRVPLWYKVKRSKTKYDFTNNRLDVDVQGESEILWYRDWRNDLPTGRGKAPSKVEDGLVYYVAINKRGKFGESELAAAKDWIKAHKEFMEDRATTHKAASQVGWKETIKGPQNVVTEQVQRLQSSLAQTIGAGWETNPPAATGSTAVHNEGVTLEWAGATPGSAESDEKLFRMMVGAGLGVMNHYFGDEGGSRLATATAMELPMLKNYEDWQQLLADTIADVLDFALTVANLAGRIGPRDDQSKYADKSMTAENTALQGDDEGDTSDEKLNPTKESGFREFWHNGKRVHAVAAKSDEPWRKIVMRESVKPRSITTLSADRVIKRVLMRAQKGNQSNAKLFDADLEEAQVSLHEAQPSPPGAAAQGLGAAAGMPGGGALGKPKSGKPTGPTEGSVTTVPSYLQVVPTAIAPSVAADQYDTEGVVDWYVDVDFPPIVAKDVNTYMFALSSMYNMMPLTNLESQKLVVSMALTALGVNDIEEVMEKLFAPLEFLPSSVQIERDMALNPNGSMDDMEGMSLEQAIASAAQGGPQQQQQQGGMTPQPQGNQMMPTSRVAESALPARTQRVLTALRETAEAIADASAVNGNGNGKHPR